jgi:hypothetical protein
MPPHYRLEASVLASRTSTHTGGVFHLKTETHSNPRWVSEVPDLHNHVG